MCNNKDFIIAGSKIYRTCTVCGKFIRWNKPLLGSMHICLTKEEIWQQLQARVAQQQSAFQANEWLKRATSK